MDNALESFVVGNISVSSWRLHAPALLLLVLPRKSNMFPDLSASEPIPARYHILHHIQAYSSLFQPIQAYSSLFQPIQAYSSLFQPIPAYSS